MEVNDPARGTWRIGVIAAGRLQAALFLARSGRIPSRDWLIAQIATEESVAPAVLAGCAPDTAADQGAIICACFDVGVRSILRAIAEQQLADVVAVGQALRAGTNCGSCRPAIQRLLKQEAEVPVAAE